MQLWHILIIVLVLAIIIGNILLIKHSTTMDFKKPSNEDTPKPNRQKKP